MHDSPYFHTVRALLFDTFGEEQARALLDEINEIRNAIDSKIGEFDFRNSSIQATFLVAASYCVDLEVVVNVGLK